MDHRFEPLDCTAILTAYKNPTTQAGQSRSEYARDAGEDRQEPSCPPHSSEGTVTNEVSDVKEELQQVNNQSESNTQPSQPGSITRSNQLVDRGNNINDQAPAEHVIFNTRAKLVHLNQATWRWEERGFGQITLLKQKATKMTRLVMREKNTLAVYANHVVTSGMLLSSNMDCKWDWIWTSEEDVTGSKIVCLIRFASEGDAGVFNEGFEKAQRDNAVVEAWLRL